jgi:threonine aldolase
VICDLRSDVLGPVSPKALQALAAAAARAPGFGRRDDPDERALTEEAASLFGFEDALFVPTGTMANQIAVRLWLKPGEALIADRRSHVATNEASSLAGLNGVVVRTLEGPTGHPTVEQLNAILTEREGSAPERPIRLLWLENTHNRAGGTVMPIGRMVEIARLTRNKRLAMHVDGARIWNALAVTGQSPRLILAGASSALVALNKIAGAPAGALLLGSRDFIEEAAGVQKMFGGLWRPAGALAAAARVVLEQWPERVRAAHAAAQAFAERVKELGDRDAVDTPETNIVMLHLGDDMHVERFMAALGDDRVRASPYKEGLVRCCFHAGISIAQAHAAAETVAQALRNAACATPACAC